MSLVTLPHPIAYPGFLRTIGNGPAIGGWSTVDAAGEYIALIGQALEDMVVSHIAWRTETVTGTSDIDIRIETVDSATGEPTGTLWDTNTNVVTGSLTSDTNYIDALGASATINKGDVFAVKFAFNSGAVNLAHLSRYNENVQSFPWYRVNNSAGAVSKSGFTGMPIVGLGSSASTFYKWHPWAVPGSTSYTNNQFDAPDTPGVRGMRFRIPFKSRITGFTLYAGTNAGGCTFRLYDDEGTQLATGDHPGQYSLESVSGVQRLLFDAPVELDADTWYRIAVDATDTGANAVFPTVTFSDDFFRDVSLWEDDAHYTTFDGSSWDDSATLQVPIVDLNLDQIDDGAGAGGGGGGSTRGYVCP